MFKMFIFFVILMAIVGVYLGFMRLDARGELAFQDYFTGICFYFYMCFLVGLFCLLGHEAESFENSIKSDRR